VPLVVGWNVHNTRYRAAKAAKLGHLLPLLGSPSLPDSPGPKRS
jgi:hypothetical protein